MPTFMEKLQAQWDAGKFVCVGLDTDCGKLRDLELDGQLPHFKVLSFNERIIEATKDLVCAYKPNTAFYEALGSDGLNALHHTIRHIQAVLAAV